MEVEIKKFVKYTTETYFFYLNIVGSTLVLSPIKITEKTKLSTFVNIENSIENSFVFPSNIQRTKIEAKVKEISGCEKFKIELFNKETGKYQ